VLHTTHICHLGFHSRLQLSSNYLRFAHCCKEPGDSSEERGCLHREKAEKAKGNPPSGSSQDLTNCSPTWAFGLWRAKASSWTCRLYLTSPNYAMENRDGMGRIRSRKERLTSLQALPTTFQVEVRQGLQHCYPRFDLRQERGCFSSVASEITLKQLKAENSTLITALLCWPQWELTFT